MPRYFFFVLIILICIPLEARSSDLTDQEAREIMVLAAHEGDWRKVPEFLACGVDPNATDGKGRTALMGAASKGVNELIEILLKKGADINMADSRGFTALMYGAEKGHVDTVKLMLDNGADCNIQDTFLGLSALMIACQKGNLPIARLLVEKGANVTLKDSKGCTAIAYASGREYYWEKANSELFFIRGRKEPVEGLGGDPKPPSGSAIRDRLEIVKLLKAHGASEKP
jgi:ankyrin repeat protein